MLVTLASAKASASTFWPLPRS